MPDIGLMRHRLAWQTNDAAPADGMNESTDVWATVATIWAHVEPMTGMELMNARQLKSTTGHKVTCRNVGPIKPSDRFLFEATGRILGIDQVFRVDERNAYLAIHCSEQKSPQ